jgi:hypothetical protein
MAIAPENVRVNCPACGEVIECPIPVRCESVELGTFDCYINVGDAEMVIKEHFKECEVANG